MLSMSLQCLFPSAFNSHSLAYYFQPPSRSHFLCILLPLSLLVWRSILTFPLFISSTGPTICSWPWPHCIVPQAQTHVITIPSNIRRVEKDCHDRKYTGFALGLRRCRGKRTHKSLILAQRLVGEIKQRQMASPSRDGAPDKDLSMVHFNGTEGLEGGRVVWREGERVQVWKCGKGCGAGAQVLRSGRKPPLRSIC